jgi:Holliday junction resolvase RusA-like endonuclease
MIESDYNIILTVLGLPHAQMRARAVAYGKHARVYKHPKQEKAENNFIAQVVQQLPPGFAPYLGALQVDLCFYLLRPKSHYGTGKNIGKLKKSAPRHPTTTPDFDNTIKHVCDCLNRVVWNDDKQICRATIYKAYTDSNRPLTQIFIAELD